MAVEGFQTRPSQIRRDSHTGDENEKTPQRSLGCSQTSADYVLISNELRILRAKFKRSWPQAANLLVH